MLQSNFIQTILEVQFITNIDYSIVSKLKIKFFKRIILQW